MPAAKPIDPEAVAYAVKAVKGGASLREVQAELAELDVHVSHETVRGWVRRAAADPPVDKPVWTAGHVLGMFAQAAADEAGQLAELLGAEGLDQAAIELRWAELGKIMSALLKCDDS